MRVVALVPGTISDQILFFPTLDHLKHDYPHAQIDVIVEPRSKAAYRVSKCVHEVLTFDYQDRNSLADWGNLVGIIRDREYDAAIAVKPSWWVSLLLWLTGIPTRIGYAGKNSFFLTNSIPFLPSPSAAAVYHDLLQPFGINSPCPDLAINIPKSDIEWSQQEQQRLGVNETGYILINGAANQVENIYPTENWQQIIQVCLRKQPDLPVVLVQGYEDEPWVRSLRESCPEIKITFPDNIGKLAAIIGGASLMLSSVSTPLHLSIAVQTYTIALLGITEPALLLPTSDKFLAIASSTDKVADISPETILEKIWGG